jgi:hypothetical protein
MLVLSPAAPALIPLPDEELSNHTGAAIAIGWENLRFLSGATTYLEALGDSTLPPVAPWKRGDLRWYGFGYSGVTPVSGYAGPCTAGIGGMGCPIGDTIPYFMPFDNPLLIRVQDYTALRFSGSSLTQTVFEFLGPTDSSPFRYSWWGEVMVNQNQNDILQGQAISNNVKLSTVDQPGGSRNNMKIRIVKHTNLSDPTLGFIWENHWAADFRYSVNQAFYSADTYGVAPVFTSTEGFYTRNIRVFMPVGQLHYQSLIVDDVGGSGNFRWEVTRPTSAGAYTHFYAQSAGDTQGYTRSGLPTGTALTAPNWYRTHGYFEFGDYFPADDAFAPAGIGSNVWPATHPTSGAGSCANAAALPATQGVGCNGRFSISDGMFFVSYDQTSNAARFTAFSDVLNVGDFDGGGNNVYGVARINNPYNGLTNVVNLGDSRFKGILINHLEIRTTGL